MSRRQRVTTALLLAPLPILALLFLPTPWLAALVAAVLLAGLWEWTAFAGLRETLPRLPLNRELTTIKIDVALEHTDLSRSQLEELLNPEKLTAGGV